MSSAVTVRNPLGVVPCKRIGGGTEVARRKSEPVWVGADERFQGRAPHERAVVKLDTPSGSEAHPADVCRACASDRLEQRPGSLEPASMARKAGGWSAEPVRQHRTVAQDHGKPWGQ
jgi:hypothetical protein